jgi:hypothetical protein
MNVIAPRSFLSLVLAGAAVLLAACTVTIDGDGRADGGGFSRRIGDDFFAAGDTLSLTEAVAGDAFLAAGDVYTAGEVGGDLAAAGGDLSIGGRIGGDVYAAGGNVRLDAIVDGGARVAGGDVTVGPATVIAGGTSLTGGKVDFDGEARGYLQASGGRVRIGGVVKGDVEVRADDLRIAPGTRIDGKLVYRGPSPPEIPADARIAGGVEHREAAHRRVWERAEDEVRTVAGWAARIALFAGVFLAGALYLGLFPRFAARAADSIRTAPLPSLGLGFALLFCVPVLGVILLLTIVGIPLALLLVPLYLLLMLLGWLNAGAFVGQRAFAALGRAGPQEPPVVRYLALLAGLVVLWLLRQLPYVGGLVGFLALLLGIGALAVELWRLRSRPTPDAAAIA